VAGEEGAIRCNNYAAFTLDQLYAQVHGGPGTSVVDPTVAGLTALGPKVTDSARRLRELMQRAGVDWRGHAAVAAGDAVRRTARWVDDSGRSTGTGGGAIGDYAASWNAMLRRVEPPKPVPPPDFWNTVTEFFGGGSDHALAVRDNDEARKRTIEAMQAHETAARYAVSAFQDPPPPPATGANDHLAGAGPVALATGHPADSGWPAPKSGTNRTAGTPTTSGTPALGGAPAGGAPTPGGAPTEGVAPAGGAPNSGGAPDAGGAQVVAGAPTGAPTGAGTAGRATDHDPEQTIPSSQPAANGSGPPAGSAGNHTGAGPTPGRWTGSGSPDSVPAPPVPASPPSSSAALPPAARPRSAPALPPTPAPEQHYRDAQAGRAAASGEPSGGALGPDTGVGQRRAGGLGGMPMGPLVGAAGGAADHEHRNSRFLPSDEPFTPALEDHVVPPVITSEHLR
jgi:hypothetical protein